VAAADPSLESILREKRSFPPPAGFASHALLDAAAAERLRRQAEEDPDRFWAAQAACIDWQTPWTKVLDWQPPRSRWFVGGRLNLSANCLDRHLAARGSKIALLWEGEPGDVRRLTYRELHAEVCRFANVLKSLGVKAGDRVGIYLPMVPEAAVAMLACARIGAVHSVVFGGFSADAIRDRMNDAGASVVVTADALWRRGKALPLKAQVDAALEGVPSVRRVVVVRRTGEAVTMLPGRDLWWHDEISKASADCPAESLDSEHPLFILYTSGSTGKPKGVLHTTGGYAVGTTLTTRWVFDLKENDLYWCTADVGWVTGHSYVVYGPLSNGASVLMYEGAPNHPGPDRFWDLVARHKPTILYTAPTAIRAFMKWGEEHPAKHDLSSLRLLGSVGEPINPEAWMWYRRVIGGDRCPIVDTWWQTETGAILIAPLPGATATPPGSATKPLPGIAAEVVRKDGTKCNVDEGGFLVIRRPWPSMLRTVYGDDERYVSQYWSQIPGAYFAGDSARVDKDGNFWMMGRVDDVIKVSGHRLGSAEVESALVSHPAVAEAAVVGRPHELTGESIVAFVTLKQGAQATQDDLKRHVTTAIGAIARPEEVRFAEALPKTRSGKIMRRLLREVASGHKPKGDVTTLEDFAVIQKLLGAGTDED